MEQHSYAMMPLEDYQAMCDAVRRRTNVTNKIKSGDMTMHIGAIVGGEEVAVSVDFSQYDNGIITETYENGSTKTYSFEFDDNGNVSKVTEGNNEVNYFFEFDDNGSLSKISDSEGNETVIVGDMPSVEEEPSLEGTETYVALEFTEGNMVAIPDEGEGFTKVTIVKPANLLPENIVKGIVIAGIAGTREVPEILENIPIALDFSKGNQLVEVPDGQAVKSAVIHKPTELVAENIAEGVSIAGITGTHSGGLDIELLEDLPIVVDFSEGNQNIAAPEGTAVKTAVIQKPETLIPENIAEGVNIAGIVGTLVPGVSDDIILFERQEVSGFAANAEFGGAYVIDIMPPPFALEVGKDYIVEWDGVEYTVTGQDVSAAVAGSVAVGNCAAFGFTGNNEPFAIATNSVGVAFVTFDTGTSHTVKVYQKASGETVIFAKQDVEGFEGSDGMAVVVYEGNTPFTLEAGKTYKVIWDNQEYTCEATSHVIDGVDAILMGNVSFMGLSNGNNEPFGMTTDGTTALLVVAYSEDPVHNIAVYKLGEQENSIETVETEVALDFSNGDMEVIPEDDKAFSKVDILKPENLVPENIAEGVDIAGIVGTLAVGGGGGALLEGVYLTASEAPPAKSYLQKRVVFNNELYTYLTPYTNDGDISQVYKWNGTSWETVATGMTGGMSCKLSNMVVFNGKIHFFRNQDHYTHDGKSTSFVAKNDLPTSSIYAFVYQNKLHHYSVSNGTIYEWNESNDVWSAVANPFSNSTYAYPYVINENLYFIANKAVYLYENGSVTQVGTMSTSTSWTSAMAVGNKIYNFSSQTVYCYDVSTHTEKIVGKIPPFKAMYFTYNADFLQFQGRTIDDKSASFPWFDVKIIE